ncbi:unnamed protein product [Cochlearia groenlandica]
MNSSNTVVGGRGSPSSCVCGAGVTIFTSKTQENPGRKFYRCSNKKDPNSWTKNRDLWRSILSVEANAEE